MEQVVNRVAKSSLVSIDLEKYVHTGGIRIIDIKDQLYQELILKEKAFRAFINQHDWTQYKNMNIGLICTSDAIVPVWAYMLLAAKLDNIAHTVTFGDEDQVEKAIIHQAVDACLLTNDIDGKKVILKGCGNIKNHTYAITYLTFKCTQRVSSLMYGEPCSTVPIFKSKRIINKKI